MREFIRAYGKLAGLFAAAALVLSFLTGIVARNPIGTVILRAVLLALLFGGLGVGLQFVVRRFLPGLGVGTPPGVGAPPNDGAEGEAAASGSQVDIVLPEENPLAAGGAAAPDGSLEESGAVAVEDGLEAAGDEGEAVLLGEPGPTGEPTGPGGTLEAAGEQPGRRTPGGELDALPDIGGLEQAPQRKAGRTRPARASFSGAAADEALRRMVEDEDPATLARAIHTVVKREEKG